jgi:hypothetical protein
VNVLAPQPAHALERRFLSLVCQVFEPASPDGLERGASGLLEDELDALRCAEASAEEELEVLGLQLGIAERFRRFLAEPPK